MTTAFLVLCLFGSSFWAEELRACAVFTEAAHLPSVVNAEAAPLAVLLDVRTVLVNIVHSTLRGIIILSTISKIVVEPPEVHTARNNPRSTRITKSTKKMPKTPQKYNYLMLNGNLPYLSKTDFRGFEPRQLSGMDLHYCRNSNANLAYSRAIRILPATRRT